MIRDTFCCRRYCTQKDRDLLSFQHCVVSPLFVCVSFWTLWYVYSYLIELALDVNQRSPSSCAPAVSPRDDQPHVEVGGCMERAGLPGSQCFLCRARRERTLAEICPLGTAWSLFANRVILRSNFCLI